MIFVLTLLIPLLNAQAYLLDQKIQFSLSGTITYVPSSGGIAVPGYSISLGFSRFSWLGIQFMTLTSQGNYDTLILRRTAAPSGGFYTCSVSDFYVGAGRPTQILSDTINNLDKTVTSLSPNSTFTLTFPRTTANTKGEDWQGGDFTQVCFFTSDISFDTTTWTKQYNVCYGYAITAYVSFFEGLYITQMQYEFTNTSIYGGILGPFLRMHLFWYRPNATLSNDTVLIRVGEHIADTGYDYYSCTGADYYGETVDTLNQDITYSGYQDGVCSKSVTATSVRVQFKRDVRTNDVFDTEITQTINMCIGSRAADCALIKLPILYPIESVASALQSYQQIIYATIILIIMFII